MVHNVYVGSTPHSLSWPF